MQIVCQRVGRASVKIDEKILSQIGLGLLLFVCLEKGDTLEDVNWSFKKIKKLRVFCDPQDKMSLNCSEINGEILCISQFTLCASLKKGNRPSFTEAMEPGKARELFEIFIVLLQEVIPVKTGSFGEFMVISSENIGPVTILLNSRDR